MTAAGLLDAVAAARRLAATTPCAPDVLVVCGALLEAWQALAAAEDELAQLRGRRRAPRRATRAVAR